MIESLTFLNFQKFKEFRVEFDPRVTCFVGRSRSGKSATLRALIWALTNQPDGLEFLGDWGKAPYASARVKIDGRSVTRKKGKTQNSYALDGETLVSFGRGGIPQPIENVVNVGEINFQGQHDPPFWLTLPAPEVSRRMNAVINLGLIDSTLANAASEVRKTKATVEIVTERLNTATERLDSTKWAVRADRKLRQAETTAAAVQTLQLRVENVALAASGIAQATQTLARVSRAILRSSDAIVTGERYSTLTIKKEQVDILLAGIDTARKRAFSLERTPDLKECEQLRTRIEELQLKKRAVDSALIGISQLEHAIQVAELEIASDEAMLRKQTKGKCPTCNQPLPKR